MSREYMTWADMMKTVKARLWDWGEKYEDIKQAGYSPVALEYRLITEGPDGSSSTNERGYGATLGAVIRWEKELGVHNAVLAQPYTHQNVICGHFCLRMSKTEIAKRLEITRQHVHYRLSDSIQDIAKYLYPVDFHYAEKDLTSVIHSGKKMVGCYS